MVTGQIEPCIIPKTLLYRGLLYEGSTVCEVYANRITFYLKLQTVSSEVSCILKFVN